MCTSASGPPTERCIGMGVSHSPRDWAITAARIASITSPKHDGPADLVERDGAHRHRRIFRIVSRLTLRPESTTTVGDSSRPAFPVRQAATVTAAEGSTRY